MIALFKAVVVVLTKKKSVSIVFQTVCNMLYGICALLECVYSCGCFTCGRACARAHVCVCGYVRESGNA